MRNRQKWEGMAITLGGSLLAIVIALGLCAILLVAIGENPFKVYRDMLEYGTSKDSFLDEVQRAVPLMLSATAVAIGFKMKLFNIGVEGQTRIAVLLTAAIGAEVRMPAVLHVTFCIVLAMAVGAAGAGIAGVLKVKRGVNEVISTIMLNYIFIGLVSWMFDEFFIVSTDTLNVKTKQLPRTAWFPDLNLLDGSVTGFVIIALAVIAIFWLLVWKTRFGFHLRASGANAGAARVAGVNPGRMVMTAMLLSGAVAGLVGLPGLLGDSHAYRRGLAEGYGFEGIAVALLGRNHPVGIVLASLLFGFLDRASAILQVNQIPQEIVQIIKGVTVLAVVIVNAALKRWYDRRTQRVAAVAIGAIDLEAAAA
ncbi:MAG TPA: ABC transporter permease [Ilumatobacteraceae bacterium]|nr:ABC transporter permease [Ilumatobacteraceae bacterium]